MLLFHTSRECHLHWLGIAIGWFDQYVAFGSAYPIARNGARPLARRELCNLPVGKTQQRRRRFVDRPGSLIAAAFHEREGFARLVRQKVACRVDAVDAYVEQSAATLLGIRSNV